MGRDRSARVSAVGRRANLALDALQGAAVTGSFASDAASIARNGARRTACLAPDARCLQVGAGLSNGAAAALCLLLNRLDRITGLLVVDPRGAVALLEDPPTTELNAPPQFGIGISALEFGIDLPALLFQALDDLGNP